MSGLALPAVLGLMGLLGVATLLLQPVPPLAGIDDSLRARALLAVQPAILTMVCVALGAFAAPRVGLGAPGLAAMLGGDSPWAIWRAALGPVGLVAVGSAAVIAVYGALTAPLLAEADAQDVPLVSRLFYGGVTEEIMVRWGLMSLLVWFAMLAFGPGNLPFWIGIVLAALLFAAGHLPLLYALIAAPPVTLVAGVLIGNTLVGLGFGWLYWRHGLEAAMAAHAGAHLIAWLGGRIAGGGLT